MPKKLVVVDNSDYVNRWQAFSWFSDSNVVTVSIGSRSQFITAMTQLVAQGAVFDKVVFRTHGYHTGIIWFGNDRIGAGGWLSLAGEINFPALFPGPTKVYFDACETADGEEGDKFLTKAGQTLLRAGGGSTSGWTSSGLALPGFIPIVGGHTIHSPNYDNLKTFYFRSGGVLWSPPAEAAPSNADVWGENGKPQKPNIGNKI
ncbi:hypothetical protein JQ625_09445 [Bradyrhizobium diazoefficiens]|nr:hypothetical protein [Bradyrhizobium diazoefficiens]MBR0775057.1 hypothetical protein [Bradyrhizobium diazoefficiens]